MMAWVVLFLSGLVEAVWATALGFSDGFAKKLPTVIFAVGYVLSVVGLAWAMKYIPPATAYVVWTAIGASVTVMYAMATGIEQASLLKAVLLVVIIACVAGLHYLSHSEGA